MFKKLKRSKTMKPKTVLAPAPTPTGSWAPADLVANSITVRSIEPQQFFGHEPLSLDPLPPTSVFTPEVYTTPLPLPLSACDTLPEPTYDMLTYLTWVVQAVPGEESTLTDLLGSLLKGVGFVPDRSVVRVSKRFEFKGNARQGYAQADLAVQSVEGLVTLVAGVGMPNTTVEQDLEAQLIESAIACFHSNNGIRKKLGLDMLEAMEMPAVTLIGTILTFYFIPVDKTLGLCPALPLPPKAKAIKGPSKSAVTKCQPIQLGHPGMEDVHSRRASFAYLTAFQGLAEGTCRRLRAGL